MYLYICFKRMYGIYLYMRFKRMYGVYLYMRFKRMYSYIFFLIYIHLHLPPVLLSEVTRNIYSK